METGANMAAAGVRGTGPDGQQPQKGHSPISSAIQRMDQNVEGRARLSKTRAAAIGSPGESSNVERLPGTFKWMPLACHLLISAGSEPI
jgi:hypothetical protein